MKLEELVVSLADGVADLGRRVDQPDSNYEKLCAIPLLSTENFHLQSCLDFLTLEIFERARGHLGRPPKDFLDHNSIL